MQEFAEISKAALALSLDERTILANQLAASLHADEDPDVKEAWMKVVRRRVEEVRSGAVVPVDSEVVFSEARRTLRK